jgi:hypothetical protein
MSTADKLICSLEISTDQLVAEAKQFDGAILNPQRRAEAAELLADTIVALAEIGHRLDPESNPHKWELERGVWNVAHTIQPQPITA